MHVAIKLDGDLHLIAIKVDNVLVDGYPPPELQPMCSAIP
jgi:hypothetical protein